MVVLAVLFVVMNITVAVVVIEMIVVVVGKHAYDMLFDTLSVGEQENVFDGDGSVSCDVIAVSHVPCFAFGMTVDVVLVLKRIGVNDRGYMKGVYKCDHVLPQFE